MVSISLAFFENSQYNMFSGTLGACYIPCYLKCKLPLVIRSLP